VARIPATAVGILDGIFIGQRAAGRINSNRRSLPEHNGLRWQVNCTGVSRWTATFAGQGGTV
jgi:hypothetical protein